MIELDKPLPVWAAAFRFLVLVPAFRHQAQKKAHGQRGGHAAGRSAESAGQRPQKALLLHRVNHALGQQMPKPQQLSLIHI